jgi:hypothetical protein
MSVDLGYWRFSRSPVTKVQLVVLLSLKGMVELPCFKTRGFLSGRDFVSRILTKFRSYQQATTSQHISNRWQSYAFQVD